MHQLLHANRYHNSFSAGMTLRYVFPFLMKFQFVKIMQKAKYDTEWNE